MRYALAGLTLGAVLTFAASTAMAANGLHDFSPVEEPQQGVTLIPADDSATVAGPAVDQSRPFQDSRGENFEAGQ